MIPTDCEACTTCGTCGRNWCREERTSPLEQARVCDDCSALADGLADWGRIA